LLCSRSHKLLGQLFHLLELVDLIENERHQHLVVSRAASVYLFAGLTKFRGQVFLYCSVAVLVRLLYNKFAGLAKGDYLLQTPNQFLRLVGLEHPYFVQHVRMGYAGLTVVGEQVQPHLWVAAHSVCLNCLVQLYSLVPEFHQYHL